MSLFSRDVHIKETNASKDVGCVDNSTLASTARMSLTFSLAVCISPNVSRELAERLGLGVTDREKNKDSCNLRF